MLSRLKPFAGVLATPVAALLFGCAVVDQYSGRAITYNIEAEQAQDQALLLNIVRAYLRRPMQFTTVSSITGVATATGGAQYTLPTAAPFRPSTQGATGIAAFPPLPTWQFSGSLSGGPAFTVPVLDTQEFYQGILKPISGQIWDLYLQAGYPRDLLFNMFVEKIVMKQASQDCPPTDHMAGCEFVFQNYVGNNIQIDLFQAVGDYLLALGLTLEQPKPKTVEFKDPKNINIRYVGAPGTDEDKQTAEVVAPPGGSTTSDAQPAPRPYGYCFAPQTLQDNACVYHRSLCGDGKDSTAKRPFDVNIPERKRTCPNTFDEKHLAASSEAQIQPSGSAIVNIIASHEFVARLVSIARRDSPDPILVRELAQFDEKPVTIKIYLRHTEGIIYYLGEVARRALHAEFEKSRPIFAKEDSPYRLHPEADCESAAIDESSAVHCGYIFRLHEGAEHAAGEFVSVNYSGRWFSVSGPNPSEVDLSSLSIDIVKQLIALNSSAKSLPQSSVLSVVGQ